MRRFIKIFVSKSDPSYLKYSLIEYLKAESQMEKANRFQIKLKLKHLFYKYMFLFFSNKFSHFLLLFLYNNIIKNEKARVILKCFLIQTHDVVIAEVY